MKRKYNRGQVLVLVALAIIVLLGFAALAIDLGYLWTVRHELQRCADAGALAGAAAFKDPPHRGSENNGTKNKARDLAKEFARKDKVITSALADNEVIVTFKANAADNTLTYFQIRVDTSRRANLFFGRIFRPWVDVNAYAIAEAATASHNVNCIKPFGISYPWNDNAPKNNLYDTGEKLYKECDPSNPTWSFCPGSLITIKVSNKDNTAIDPTPNPQTETSHFFALDFAEMTRRMPACNGPGGAAGFELWTTSQCLDDCLTISVGDSIPVEPGNMVGPTYDGAQYLIDQEMIQLHGVTRFDEGIASACGHPIFGSEDCNGTTWKLSPRVFRIPVYDPTIDQLSPGNDVIHVAKFAGMWLDHVDDVGSDGQATVYGRWMNADVIKGAGGGPTSGSPTVLYLRLVK